MINISGVTAIDDPSYRYKMPRIIPKVEGRGNGIKTVIVNVSDIATSLNRDPSEITKFFGFELGAQTTMAVDDDRYIVNGAHSYQDLQQLVHKYIELFVLCKNCHLPETHYKIKSEILSQKCVACGSKDVCDMTHKLTTFILKQQKKMKSESAAAAAATSGEKEKKEKKKEKKHKEESTGDAAEGGGAGGGGGDDEEEKLRKKEKKLKKKKAAAALAEEEAVAPAAEEGEELEGDTEREALESAIDQFKLWLSAHSDITNSLENNSSLKGPKLNQLLEELRSTQTLSALSAAYRYLILFGSLFSSQCIQNNEIVKYKELLLALLSTSGGSNNTSLTNIHSQRQLIAATEWLIGVKYSLPTPSSSSSSGGGSGSSSSLLRMFPVLLKQLYDEDLIEEEVLLSWFHEEEVRNEYTVDESIITNDVLGALKEAAKPFIIWLEQADEEEEEEGEGGDDEEEEEGN